MNKLTIASVAGLCLTLAAWSCWSSERTLKKLAVDSPNITFRYSLRQQIATVSIGRSRRDLERTLPVLRGLRGLQTLQLWGLDLSEEDMRAISKLRITKLDIHGGQIDNSSLQPLGNLQTLEHLLLVKEKGINDEGFAGLGVLGSLKEIDASFSNITGACFAQGFERLEKLRLTGCPIDNKSLKAIAKLPSLRTLGLSQTQVTGDGLENLASLHNLEQVGFPDEMPLEKVLKASQAHLRSKRKARDAGLKVPADNVSPFLYYERKANSELIKAKQKDRNLPRAVAKKVARAEMTILWLVGREHGPKIFDQVDARFEAGSSTTDYTTSTRSLAEIFEEDFAVPVDASTGFSDAVRTTKKVKEVRTYLSGKLFPAGED